MNQKTANAQHRARGRVPSLLAFAIYPVLVAVPMVCFCAALVTDIIYARSPQMQWTNFSAWLITAGLLVAPFAALALLVGYFGDSFFRRATGSGLQVVLVLSAFVIELFNIFVHSRDAYTSVVPTGLTLSAIAVALLLVAGLVGARLRHRRWGVRA